MNPRFRFTAVIMLLPLALALRASAGEPGTVVIDAAQFLDRMPPGNGTNGRAPEGSWLFNNFAMTLRKPADAAARVKVAEAGTYHLFVRSSGRSGRFQVSVGGRKSGQVFGEGDLALRPGGSYDLKPGPVEIKLTDVTPGSLVDVVVLSTNPDLKEADLAPLQYGGDATVLKEYAIPRAHAVKFGDVTGDGKIDFMVLTPNYSAYVFDHDGKELWHYAAPAAGTVQRAEFEAPGSVWDFDQDGKAECVQWRLIDGKEWLVMADGMTGAVRHKVEWPTKPLPHVYNNFRTAVARLRPGYASDLVVLTDCGGEIAITAYDRQLKQLWRHDERRLKDHLGHYLYPRDFTGDDVDEVLLSSLMLDAKGKPLWSLLDTAWPINHDHADTFRFADITGDGKPEALAAQSNVGVVVYDPLNGQMLWQRPAAHAQQITWGDLLEGKPGPQVLVNARYYGRDPQRAPDEPPGLSAQIHYFDPAGNLLARWPNGPVNGNPDFVRGDWRGDGKPEIFWFKFQLNAKGSGALVFAEEAYHMFDFMGNGAEQVVALNKQTGVMKIYGSKDVRPKSVKRDPEYLRNSMANHSHY